MRPPASSLALLSLHLLRVTCTMTRGLYVLICYRKIRNRADGTQTEEGTEGEEVLGGLGIVFVKVAFPSFANNRPYVYICVYVYIHACIHSPSRL